VISLQARFWTMCQFSESATAPGERGCGSEGCSLGRGRTDEDLRKEAARHKPTGLKHNKVCREQLHTLRRPR